MLCVAPIEMVRKRVRMFVRRQIDKTKKSWIAGDAGYLYTNEIKNYNKEK